MQNSGVTPVLLGSGPSDVDLAAIARGVGRCCGAGECNDNVCVCVYVYEVEGGEKKNESFDIQALPVRPRACCLSLSNVGRSPGSL